MTASVGFTGGSITLGLGANIPSPTYTLLGEVYDIDLPARQVKFASLTNNSSPADTNGLIYDEFVAATVDGGKAQFKCKYNPADAVKLEGKIGVFQAVEVQFPKLATQVTKGDAFTFVAAIEECKLVGPLENAVEYDITLQVTGLVTFTAGA